MTTPSGWSDSYKLKRQYADFNTTPYKPSLSEAPLAIKAEIIKRLYQRFVLQTKGSRGVVLLLAHRISYRIRRHVVVFTKL